MMSDIQYEDYAQALIDKSLATYVSYQNTTIPYRFYKRNMPSNMLTLYEARLAEEKRKAN